MSLRPGPWYVGPVTPQPLGCDGVTAKVLGEHTRRLPASPEPTPTLLSPPGTRRLNATLLRPQTRPIFSETTDERRRTTQGGFDERVEGTLERPVESKTQTRSALLREPG